MKIVDIKQKQGIIWAAATDAADRHMKSHGRDIWNDADYNYACSEYKRLMEVEPD